MNKSETIASGASIFRVRRIQIKLSLPRWLFPFIILPILFSCSTTKNIPDDDQLFVGLTKIEYKGYEKSQHFNDTKEEVEAALATAPNGALFGSSYYRTPFPYGLWIWNWADGSSGKLKKWMKKSFGKPPVLMSQVNPALRASVAQSVLRKNGYMHATVTYSEVPQKNPKKMKIGYTVYPDTLFLIDTISYEHFPPQMQHLIDSTAKEARIKTGSPFSVGNLDAERTRLSQLMRNNGYYYYQPGYASYLADTFQVKNRVHLRLQLADSLPENVLSPWYIGKITMQMRRSYREQMTDSVDRSFLKIRYNGKRPPMRPGVVLRNMKLRPRRLYSNDDYQESMQKVNATGVFSTVDFRFSPNSNSLLNSNNDSTRIQANSLPSTQKNVLDLNMNCVFDQPYDFYAETDFVNRTIGRFGPEVKVGMVRRNAFRGGERIDVNLHGAYEWQTSGNGSNNSYQYGIDASVEFPRILLPFRKDEPSRREGEERPRRRRRFYSTPWTIAKVSSDIIRRPDYYKMHIVTGEWTYRWQRTQTSQHEFSPLTVKYQFMNSHTPLLDSLIEENAYIAESMDDRFIPKMRYTYTYKSAKEKRNPIRWETSIEEAGNLLSLYYLAKGEGWNTKDKKLFKNPYSQFIRLETDLTKTWTLNASSQLVGHINAGVLFYYGNSAEAPFSEKFYVGGANSIRAFPVRSIGPGEFIGLLGGNQFSYIIRNGDSKLVMNLEYRRNLVGSLYGAIFIDAGNVWDTYDWHFEEEWASNEEELKTIMALNELFAHNEFKINKLFSQLATGTGIGLRYDLDFLVIRVDWGFGLHVPYETGKSGYFNISSFKDMQTLHLAIGYPF